jgi:hypothetical protein
MAVEVLLYGLSAHPERVSESCQAPALADRIM